jgi:hypothetical protein
MSDSSLFGHTLLVANGDLVMTGGAMLQVVGRDNLIQALQLRVQTPFSSDVFNAGYGLDVREIFTQANSPGMVRELIKLNLVRTLGTDGRVQDIQDIIFEDDPQYLIRHPEVTSAKTVDDRHRRLWNVDVIITAIDNQTQTLAAGVGLPPAGA